MNKNFAEWYRGVDLEPVSEQLKNRCDGIVYFIENELNKDNIFELIRLFYNKPVKEEFHDKYVECLSKFDSAFNRNADYEICVLAGATLVEIIEEYDYAMLAMLATISFSFLGNSPMVLDIFQIISEKFAKESCYIRERILQNNNDQIKYPESKNLLEVLEAENSWCDKVQTSLINYIKEIDNRYKEHKKIQDIYCEDSQILWWMTGEWSNDLDKPFSQMKQADVSLYIGKELADKIVILPGPYSAKVIIHKMLQCCNKKNKFQSITLRAIVDNSDVAWRQECLKKYDINNIEEITPIIFAISKSLTVDAGDDWNPQFKKITKCSCDDIKNTVEKVAFQMYLECLTIKCYSDIEE